MGAGLGDRNKGDLGGERLRKLKTRGDRLCRQLRAVGCDQNMLEHGSLPRQKRHRLIGCMAQYQLDKRPSKWAGVSAPTMLEAQVLQRMPGLPQKADVPGITATR